MSIFDITPAGAYMNAIKAANEKDRQNARRIQDRPDAAVRRTSRSAAMRLTNALRRAFETIAALRPAASLWSKSL